MLKPKATHVLGSLFIPVIFSFAAYGAQVASGHKLAPLEQQVFVSQLGGSPVTIDPQMVEETQGSQVATDLFEGLFNQDKLGNPVPAGALSYTVSADNLVYTFKLRKESKWSNGQPVTAHDYVYGWQRAIDPVNGSNYAGYLEMIHVKNAGEILRGKLKPSELGIKALDDYTLRVNLSKPTSYFIKTLTHATVTPAPRSVIEKYGKNWVKPENIVTNGAYTLKEWVPNEKIVLTKNNLYWDAENTIIQQVTNLIINSDQAAYNRYRAQELDYTLFPDHLLKKLKKSTPDEVINAPNLATYYYGMDTQKKPFNDVNVRKALSYAIDRDIITEKVLGQGQLPAYTFVPPYTSGFSYAEPEIAKLSQKERIAKAKVLLQEAGYGPSNPLSFELLYNTDDGHKKIAVAIANMWKRSLNAKVTLNNMEWKTMLARLDDGNYDVYRAGWVGDYNDPMTFLNVFSKASGTNRTKWTNAQYDAYLGKANIVLDENERNVIYQKAENIMANEVPVIPIYFYVSSRLLNPKIKGFPRDNPMLTVYAKDLYVVQN